MKRALLHQLALFRLYYSDVFAYKAAAFIWMLSDVQVALMMPLVWRAVGGVAGLSADEVVTYYIVALSVSQFVTCHLLWDIAWDIREGAFLSQLMRPVSHLKMSFARNLAWRIGKLVLFVPVFLLMLVGYGATLNGKIELPASFWLSLIVGQTMAFFAAYTVALIALWSTEVSSLFQIYYFPEMLLSGRVVPLGSMPQWVQNIANWTHFKYTVAFPTEIAMGHLRNSEIARGLAIQAGWLIFFVFTARVMFGRGVRQYYGFGL